MGALRLAIVLTVAALAAVALALLVGRMTSHKPTAPIAAQPVERPMTRVLVAKRDLNVADPISADTVGWQPWPADSINPAFITGGAAVTVSTQGNLAAKAASALQAASQSDAAVQSLAGSLVREPILANEPITAAKLVRGGAGGYLAVKLPRGQRAVSVPVTVETGAGGFILPGDHVDVLVSVKRQPGAVGEAGPGTRLVLNNVEVLAVDQNPAAKAGTPTIVGQTATLQMAADDVEPLIKARTEGDLVLSLRSYADANGPSGHVGPSSASGSDVIRVHRNGQVTVVSVSR